MYDLPVTFTYNAGESGFTVCYTKLDVRGKHIHHNHST